MTSPPVPCVPVLTAMDEPEALAVAAERCPVAGAVVRVGGRSMYPTIAAECLAVLRDDFGTVRPGDICAIKLSRADEARYPAPSRAALLLHRVTAPWGGPAGAAWQTRGDNRRANHCPDAFPLDREHYGGTVVCFVTWAGAPRTGCL